jgi:hypothetical protein
MADYLTYLNIRDRIKAAARKSLGSNDTLIDYIINMVYLNEVIISDDIYPYHWLIDFDDSLQSKPVSNISAVSQASAGIIDTAAAHGLRVGSIFSIHNVSGMTELNDRLHIVYSIPSTTQINIGTDTSGYTAYTSGGVINHHGETLNVSGKDVHRVLKAGFQEYQPMSEITYQEIEDNTEYHDTDHTGIPDRYYHGKDYATDGTETNQLIWYPAADQEIRLRYWFVKRVSRLSADGDVPVIPHRFHDILVSGTLSRLVEQGVQVDTPSIWPSTYASQLDALREDNRKYFKENDKAFREKMYLV